MNTDTFALAHDLVYSIGGTILAMTEDEHTGELCTLVRLPGAHASGPPCYQVSLCTINTLRDRTNAFYDEVVFRSAEEAWGHFSIMHGG